jgi:hypothetical protein
MMVIPTKAKGRAPAICDACGGREQVSECKLPYSASKPTSRCQWYDLCLECRQQAASLPQDYVSLKDDLGDLLLRFSGGRCRQ